MNDRERKQLLDAYPQIFDEITSRYLNSPNPEERRMLFHGYSLEGRHPVSIKRDQLFHHAHFLGDPGSGKSGRGLDPLISQLIASAEVSVNIFDAKGELAQFHNAREEAERAGVPFKYFTNCVGWASHIWNPFAEPSLSRMTFAQRAQQIIEAMGLDHGEIYGGSFFTSSMRLVTENILERYSHAIHSLADLHRFCADGNAYKGLGPKQDWLNSRHLVSNLRAMSGVLPLVATPKDVPDQPQAIENAISVEETLTRPVVNYFFLPSTRDSNQATNIIRLNLLSLLNAAAIYKNERRTCDVFNFIDEAQYFATHSLPLILNLARSHRLAIILAHQSLDQLKTGALDLTQIVLSATGCKRIFRSSDLLSRDYLMKTGGEALYHKLSWNQPVQLKDDEPAEGDLRPSAAEKDGWTGRPVVNVQEETGPRLRPNTIMEVSADPALSLINFTEDSGPVQYGAAWTTVISGFHIDRATYEQRAITPWPAPDKKTVIVPQEWRPGTPPAKRPNGASRGHIDDRVQDALKRLKVKQQGEP